MPPRVLLTPTHYSCGASRIAALTHSTPPVYPTCIPPACVAALSIRVSTNPHLHAVPPIGRYKWQQGTQCAATADAQPRSAESATALHATLSPAWIGVECALCAGVAASKPLEAEAVRVGCSSVDLEWEPPSTRGVVTQRPAAYKLALRQLIRPAGTKPAIYERAALATRAALHSRPRRHLRYTPGRASRCPMCVWLCRHGIHSMRTAC